MNRLAGTSYTHKPRGSWKINGIYVKNDDGSTRLPTINDNVVYVSFTVTEPLLLSVHLFLDLTMINKDSMVSRVCNSL
jgi:hypothetical protein